MTFAETKFAVVNGFDRSGTSMIARLLANHPDVELFFQPFNSTVLHRSQWEYWDHTRSNAEVEDFLTQLINGHVDRDFISSDWFERYSTTLEVVPGKLHVIKSTKLHFKVDWLTAKFPELKFYAILRDVRAVLCSLLRNDFYERWYGEAAYADLLRYVRKDEQLPDRLREAVESADSDLKKMAAIVGVRTEVMLRAVPRERVIRYGSVLNCPNDTLNGFTSTFGLADFNFAAGIGRDYNVIGKQFGGHDLWKTFFDVEQIRTIEQIVEGYWWA